MPPGDIEWGVAIKVDDGAAVTKIDSFTGSMKRAEDVADSLGKATSGAMRATGTEARTAAKSLAELTRALEAQRAAARAGGGMTFGKTSLGSAELKQANMEIEAFIAKSNDAAVAQSIVTEQIQLGAKGVGDMATGAKETTGVFRGQLMGAVDKFGKKVKGIGADIGKMAFGFAAGNLVGGLIGSIVNPDPPSDSDLKKWARLGESAGFFADKMKEYAQGEIARRASDAMDQQAESAAEAALESVDMAKATETLQRSLGHLLLEHERGIITAEKRAAAEKKLREEFNKTHNIISTRDALIAGGKEIYGEATAFKPDGSIDVAESQRRAAVHAEIADAEERIRKAEIEADMREAIAEQRKAAAEEWAAEAAALKDEIDTLRGTLNPLVEDEIKLAKTTALIADAVRHGVIEQDAADKLLARYTQTVKEAREEEERLLEVRQRSNLIDLGGPTDGMSEREAFEYKLALDHLSDRLERDRARQAIEDKVRGVNDPSPMGKIRDDLAAIQEFRAKYLDVMASVRDGGIEAFQAVRDSMVNLFTTGELGVEELGKTFNRIMAQIATDMILAWLLKLAGGSAYSGPGSGMGDNLLSPDNPNFNEGGSYIARGSGGPDSQLYAHYLTPGERVTIETKRDQRMADGGGRPVMLKPTIVVQTDVRQMMHDMIRSPENETWIVEVYNRHKHALQAG